MGFDEKQLRGFVAVATAGSIGKAASLANMSQPTLSRLIRGIEERHGAPLFERLAKGIALTEAGRAFLPHARLLLFEMEQAADTLRAVRGLRRGLVRVGGVPSVIRPIVMPAVAALREVAPGLQVEVHEMLDNRLVDALTGHAIDLMIAANIEVSPDIQQIGEWLFEDTYNVYCGPSHELADRSGVRAADVMPGEWAMPPAGTTTRIVFEDIIRKHALGRPNIVIESASPNAILAAVVSAGVLGWLGGLAAAEMKTGAVQRLELPEFQLTRRFFVYRRARGLLPAATQRFLDILRCCDSP